MDDDNELDLKLRYRCSNCKNLESHRVNDKKRKCKNCGSSLAEITEKDYHYYKHKLKKSAEEDEKETPAKAKEKEKDKKKKKKEYKKDEKEEKDETKNKKKLKKNLSTKNLDDKNYKLKKSSEEDEDKKSESNSDRKTKKNKDKDKDKDKEKDKDKKKDDKKKKKNRHKSIEKLGPIVSNIVSNLFNQKKLEKELEKLDELSFSEFDDLDGATIVVNHNDDNTTKVLVNNKEINTEVFDPIFNSFGAIFNENFVNNFLQNFSSTGGAHYYENMQTIVNDNQQFAKKHKVNGIKDSILSKLKQFKMNKKYMKKGKDGKLELPSCCICLSEIEKGKETMLLPCGHMFHYKCCLNWLKNNNTCPMCRFEIK